MVYLYFIIAAVIVVFAAIKLAEYADVMSSKTAMGGMMVGTLLLAGATSLPEVSTSFSAAAIGNADIAVGNMIGSNLFNLFVLAAFDFTLRGRRFIERAERDHLYTATLGILLTVLVILALTLRLEFTILGIGIDAIIIAVVYVAGMFIISKLPKLGPHEGIEVSEAEPENPSAKLSAKAAIARFVIAAFVILAAGTALSVTGDEIAFITGIGSSFIGSFLIAATTSLPEAVSVFIALRLRNANLAIGAILGSNVFNMIILAISDAVYRDGPIMSSVSGANMIVAVGVLIMSLLIFFHIFRKRATSTLSYVWIPSAIIVIYFAVTYLNFTY